MDFIIGLLLAIVLLMVLINFTSISISDSNLPNQQQCGTNTFFSSLGFGNGNGNGNNVNNIYQQSKIPQPVLAKAPSALNNKVNLEQQTYDYHKYFFVN